MNEIQKARKLLVDSGFGKYTVVNRCSTPSHKGSSYENKLCKVWTLWATGRDKPQIYCRTKGSGGQATRTGDTRSSMAGDMMSNHVMGDFLTNILLFEFKDRIDLDVVDFLIKPKGDSLYSFWVETVERAKKAERSPFLIYHKSRSRFDFAIMDVEFYNDCADYFGEPHPVNPVLDIDYDGRGNRCYVMRLDHFLAWVKPWSLAYCFLDDKVGRKVEENYGKGKG